MGKCFLWVTFELGEVAISFVNLLHCLKVNHTFRCNFFFTWSLTRQKTRNPGAPLCRSQLNGQMTISLTTGTGFHTIEHNDLPILLSHA